MREPCGRGGIVVAQDNDRITAIPENGQFRIDSGVCSAAAVTANFLAAECFGHEALAVLGRSERAAIFRLAHDDFLSHLTTEKFTGLEP